MLFDVKKRTRDIRQKAKSKIKIEESVFGLTTYKAIDKKFNQMCQENKQTAPKFKNIFSFVNAVTFSNNPNLRYVTSPRLNSSKPKKKHHYVSHRQKKPNLLQGLTRHPEESSAIKYLKKVYSESKQEIVSESGSSSGLRKHKSRLILGRMIAKMQAELRRQIHRFGKHYQMNRLVEDEESLRGTRTRISSLDSAGEEMGLKWLRVGTKYKVLRGLLKKKLIEVISEVRILVTIEKTEFFNFLFHSFSFSFFLDG